jgi:NADP-dependent 3-hydroxy acid dehydrogenase YdfG
MSKTILITGASSGFGRDTAETLARAGHRVFASMRNVDGRNKAHADTLRAKGIDVVELDVTSDDSVEKGVAAVLAKTDRLDVVINNAGFGTIGIAEAHTTKQLQDLFDVNVFGIHRVLRATLPTLRAQREGLVINLSSVLGRLTIPTMAFYCASKFAVESITDGYRYELSQRGVDVVSVQPSAYPTSFNGNLQMAADGERAAGYGDVAGIPGKVGEAFEQMLSGDNAPNPHDVTEAIVRLVEAPNGSRPSRVLIGAPYGADVVNQTSAAVQKAGLEALGLSFLDKSPA